MWIWTPKENKWVNPKQTVKGTPAEQLTFARKIMEEENYKLAIKEFQKLLKYYPKAKEAPKARFYIALCKQKRGQLYQAYEDLQKVIEKYPFSDLSKDIIQRQYDIGVELLDRQEGKSELWGSITGTNYKIIDIFKTVIKNAPYGDLAAPSQYKIAQYLNKNNLYQEARDEYEKVINNYPETEWAQKAQYSIALLDAERSTGSEYDQKITQVAIDELEDVVKESPQAPRKDEAIEKIQELRDKEAHNRYLVAEFYEKQENYKSAKIYYQSIVNEYKNSRWAAKALKRILDISRKENK